MKYAICILAHNKPALLEKLVNELNNSNTEIFVHLDAKCDIKEYAGIKGAAFIHKRTKVFWGGRSMISAMHNLIEHVVQNSNCGYILFISGQDFPVVKPEKYDDFINDQNNYVEYEKLPREKWKDESGGLDRVRYLYIFNSVHFIVSRVFVKLQKIVHFDRKFYRNSIEVYGGSQWININRTAAEYILRNWSYYYDHFKYCHIPDELIFQTMLLNSPLKETTVNSDLRFIKFRESESNPVYLDVSNINEISGYKALFIRKIIDEKVFDSLREILT